MSKLITVLSIIFTGLLVSNVSLAQTTKKKASTPAAKQDIVCIVNTVQTVEPDGVFVFLDSEGKPLSCGVAFKDDPEANLSPVGKRITLPNGTIVRKDVMMDEWIWVFVKNK